ncbi:MAG TPA: ligase-associated DNA damage response endonuclease PdeM [Noviherbaspirillum sp.]|jgi:DNA ligase-associated metallophosphoesterase|uniref:ligase-associated DNA damage response endonuclease PdeM n=1 Tax=Noviherbaspirillum sp. TaxID=1926288 RepID=UPI002DDD1B06|nr:ligase-associated DNA damage response endonuclease PdeM [Noviherbaspirillum sp.]HEV2609275.1 ligase-associated DNA damage response endonuclease PdeM [Noviherbaspirillum sp.]
MSVNLPSAVVAIAGETIELLPQRAAYWQARRTLLVADIHFGKAAAFRTQGVPVPHGTTAQNLSALDGIAAQREIEHILFLGDFLHAKAVQGSATMQALVTWRSLRPGLQMTLVRGNHDSHAGDPPEALGMNVVDEPHRVGPFLFCHHPAVHDDAYVFAGHVHPVYRLAGRGDMLRLPCFLIGSGCALLPSFGAFTGGYAVHPSEGDRVFVTTDDAVHEVPSTSRRTAS